MPPIRPVSLILITIHVRKLAGHTVLPDVNRQCRPYMGRGIGSSYVIESRERAVAVRRLVGAIPAEFEADSFKSLQRCRGQFGLKAAHRARHSGVLAWVIPSALTV